MSIEMCVAVMTCNRGLCCLVGAQLTAWLRDTIEEQYDGVQSKLAKAMGIDPAVFSRGLKRGTFNIKNLATLARVTGKAPATLFRWSGQTEVADMIDDLYGSAPLSLPKHARDVAELLTEHPKHVLSKLILLQFSVFQVNGLLPTPPAHKTDEPP